MFPILEDSIYYLISIYGSKLLSFIYKIIIARILGPRDYGVWSIIVLILIYGNFLHLGLIYALIREVSFYRGQGKMGEIDEIKNTVFSSLIFISTIACVALLISSAYFKKYGNNIFIAVSLISFILILQQLKNYLVYNFIADKKFKAVSEFIICASLFIGIPAVIFAKKLHFVGLPFGMLLGNCLFLLYIFIRYKPIIRFKINRQRLHSLIKIGFPLMILSLTYSFFLTVDRILIFKYLGKENLGYYNVALALYDALILFPFSLGVIIFPRLSEQYGAEGEAKGLQKFIHTPTIIIAYVMPALLGLIYLFLPSAIRILVPQYTSGINAGRIALAGIMFLSVSIFAQQFLVVINRQMHYLFIMLSALALKIIVTYYFIIRHMGINGVAMGANIVYFIYSTFIIVTASYYYKSNFIESAKYLIKIYLPFIYLLLILLSLNYFRQAPILNTGNETTQVFVNFIVLIILVVAPFGYVIKKNLFAYLKLNIFQEKK